MTRRYAMILRTRVRAILTSVLIVTTLANPVLAADRGKSQVNDSNRVSEAEPLIRDVALTCEGALEGKVLNRRGQPVADSPVLLMGQNSEIVRTRSDERGEFRFQVEKGGVHQLVTEGDAVVCRLWTATAAPPAARPAILLCTNDAVVLGQCCNDNQCRRFCCRSCGQSSCCAHTQCCNSCGAPVAPAAPAPSYEELRALAPMLPEEQFAALTRADVVITNPEHISIAIAYNPTTGTAVVVAKGEDALALQMQSVARAAGVPVVRNAPLAQALHAQVAVGQAVPQSLLGQIVEIMQNMAPAPGPGPGPGTVGGFQPTGPVRPRPTVGTTVIIGSLVAGMVLIPIAVSDDDDEAS